MTPPAHNPPAAPHLQHCTAAPARSAQPAARPGVQRRVAMGKFIPKATRCEVRACNLLAGTCSWMVLLKGQCTCTSSHGAHPTKWPSLTSTSRWGRSHQQHDSSHGMQLHGLTGALLWCWCLAGVQCCAAAAAHVCYTGQLHIATAGPKQQCCTVRCRQNQLLTAVGAASAGLGNCFQACLRSLAQCWLAEMCTATKALLLHTLKA